MSSAGANKESPGGTMKNVIDNPETQPKSHIYAEDQSDSNTNKGNKDSNNNNNQSNSGQPKIGSTHANDEFPGGTMKNVIDNPANKS